jgi:hypothetical protein
MRLAKPNLSTLGLETISIIETLHDSLAIFAFWNAL